ncbi:hypothetical protein [Desmonostoc muscorum]|nr:hypothetical protein [Desmonostoc muscorum]
MTSLYLGTGDRQCPNFAATAIGNERQGSKSCTIYDRCPKF